MDEGSFLQTNLAKFYATWRSRGAKSALRDVMDVLLLPFHRRIDRQFDKMHNVATAGSIPLAHLTIAKGRNPHDKRKYEPTSVITFRRMMSTLPRDLSDYVFVDFGSGKGRALFMASDYNFNKIIGVEFAYELHASAEKNVATYTSKHQRCSNIEPILTDAADFAIPHDKCVFYLFDPFLGTESVMTQVLDNIAASFFRNPRTMYFLYLNPRHAHLFDNVDFVRPVEKRRFALRTAIIYKSVV